MIAKSASNDNSEKQKLSTIETGNSGNYELQKIAIDLIAIEELHKTQKLHIRRRTRTKQVQMINNTPIRHTSMESMNIENELHKTTTKHEIIKLKAR